tara:strand:- start:1138 stop:1473 length:336 start_codon:yes stop_codon:yes gene_type:complete
MKLQIPKKQMTLEINNHVYTIRFIEGRKAEYGTEESEILGAISMRNCDIIIERDMADSKILEVLIHEVMHGITYGTSLGLTETQVQVMANSLFRLGFGNYLWEKMGGKYDS